MSGNRTKPWVASKNGIFLDSFRTKTEAEEYLNSLADTIITESYNMTVDEVHSAWEEERRKEGAPLYTSSWAHVLPGIRSSKMRKLRAADYQSVIDAMAEKGLKRATCDKAKQLLNFLAKWAMREDLIPKNYAEFIRLPKDDAEESTPFEDDDLAALFAHDGDPDVMAVLIMIFTGWRISEFLGLQRQNVHLEEGYMVGGLKTAAGRNRIVPICRTISDYVRYFYEHPRGGCATLEAPLVQSIYGRRYERNTWRRKHFNRALAICGITAPYTPHSTRHTFATLGDRVDLPREQLKQILGHKKYETTSNVYVHPNLEALKKAATILDSSPITSKLQANIKPAQKEKP